MKNKQSQVDRGWAWMILAAAFLEVMLGSTIYLSGIYNLVFLETFGESKSHTAWCAALHSSLLSLTGPFVSACITCLGSRRTVFLGTTFILIGYISCAFVTSFPLVFLTYGFIAGFGMGFAYMPGFVLIGLYFKRYRNLAFGIVTTSSGIGTTVMSPLLNYFIDTYGYKGSMILMAGIFSHLYVAGAVLRPIENFDDLASENLVADTEEQDKQKSANQPIWLQSKSFEKEESSHLSFSKISKLRNGSSIASSSESSTRIFPCGSNYEQNYISTSESQTMDIEGILSSNLFCKKNTNVDEIKTIESDNTNDEHKDVNNIARVKHEDPPVNGNEWTTSHMNCNINDGARRSNTLLISSKKQDVNKVQSQCNCNCCIHSADTNTEKICTKSATNSVCQSYTCNHSFCGSVFPFHLRQTEKIVIPSALERTLPATSLDSVNSSMNTSSVKKHVDNSAAVEAGNENELNGSVQQSPLSPTPTPIFLYRGQAIKDKASHCYCSASDPNITAKHCENGFKSFPFVSSENIKLSVCNSSINTSRKTNTGEFFSKMSSDFIAQSYISLRQLNLSKPPKKSCTVKYTCEEQKSTFDEHKESVFRQLISEYNHLLNKPIFLLCVNLLFINFGLACVYVHLPAFAIQYGSTPFQASRLLSIRGISNIISRMVTGLATNQNGLDTFLVYMGSCGLAGIILVIGPCISTSHYCHMMLAFCFGLYANCFVTLMSPLTIDLVGVKYLSAAYGLELFMCGIGFLLGPPIAGLAFLAGAFIILLIPLCQDMNSKTSDNTSSESP